MTNLSNRKNKNQTYMTNLSWNSLAWIVHYFPNLNSMTNTCVISNMPCNVLFSTSMIEFPTLQHLQNFK